ncbi:MAG: type VI secretion system tip protein VgrG, partial [Polyangiaceae bacterium]|nr:type VI secretion system tip protein VgrG [Polyangiaceae bacterium]
MAPPAHVLSLAIDGVDATLRVVGLELVERLHAPFRATLTCFAVDGAGVRAPLVLDELIGQKAELVFLHDTTPRTIVALVEGATEAGLDYELVLAPRLALCADRVDYRVFVEQTPLDAVKAVLGDAGVSIDDRVSAPPAKRPQIVQAFESDLAFVTRLCAEEGIALVAETADGTDRVVLGDGASPPPLPGGAELPFGAGDVAGLAAALESVYDVQLERAVVTNKVTLRDYDFERPLLDQTVTSGSGPLEAYEYPAGYLDPGVGKTLAARRLEEKRQPGHVLRARSSCRRLAVGYSFKLDGAPRDDLLGPWLVVAVTHRASDFTDAGVLGPDGGARRFEAELVAVPAGVAPRPSRPRAPTVGGIEHATVTGAAGSEIHPDKHGRVKALLRWDRRGKADDGASA